MNRHPARQEVQRRLRSQRDEVERARRERVPGGFHRWSGRQLGDVVDQDPLYLRWLSTIHIRKESFRDAVKVLRLAYDEAIATADRSREHLRR